LEHLPWAAAEANPAQIWMLFTAPGHHGRTRWWGAAFLVPLIGMYSYAFTLPESAPAY
jgi:hypothetical protein